MRVDNKMSVRRTAMITKVTVKSTELLVCAGVNVITGSLQHINDFISALGGPLSKEKNIITGIVSSEFADKKDRRDNTVIIWNRPEKWLHPKEMKDLAARIKKASDGGSQVFVLTADYLLMAWLSEESTYSDTPLPFKFFNFYESKKTLCVEEAVNSAYFSHNAGSKAYSELFDFKVTKSMGNLGK